MIRYGNIFVCANCKPRFMQKLAEGAAVPGTVRYAGFWRRFLAYFIDAAILFGVNFILQMAIFYPAFSMVTPADPRFTGADLGLLVGLYTLQFATAFTYETVLIWKYGATLGKLVCQIEVVTAEGRTISYALSVGRYFAKILNSFTCLIGYIIAAFDEEKRGLHDRLCNTRVIVK
jgi:uncharacterized RDD family membrane protein YckC